MKISLNKGPRYAAFTLIEMIGVLAVIAILASLLIPKILNAISDSKISNAVLSYNSMKTAVMEHYGKYGKFAGAGGAALTLPVEQFDVTALLPDAIIDKPWQVKIGDGLVDTTHARVRIFTTGVAAGSPVTLADGYAFDGTANNQATNSSIVEVVITGVSEADAKAYNDRLDGTTLGVGLGSAPDLKGRVKYGTSAAQTAPLVEVRTYIAHR